MKIINLNDMERAALDCKRRNSPMAVEPEDFMRILAALREANSRAASGIGYIQWHGIIDVNEEALRGTSG